MLIHIIESNSMNECDHLTRDLLSQNGFVYRKKGWYRITGDFLQILNFQKSCWSNQYYINIGEDFLPKDKEGKIEYLPEYRFPMRGRAGRLGLSKESLDCLDFEIYIEEEERRSKMTSLIEECIAFLNRVSTLDGVKQEYKNSSILKGFFIHKDFYSVISK